MTQVVLMDADRLANTMPTVVIRSGQFYPTIPPVRFEFFETRDPASTYQEPTSNYEDLLGCVEWRTWFRTEKGKELGGIHIDWLEGYLKLVADEHKKLNLLGIRL